jgi:hypothetical protein
MNRSPITWHVTNRRSSIANNASKRSGVLILRKSLIISMHSMSRPCPYRNFIERLLVFNNLLLACWQYWKTWVLAITYRKIQPDRPF